MALAALPLAEMAAASAAPYLAKYGVKAAHYIPKGIHYVGQAAHAVQSVQPLISKYVPKVSSGLKTLHAWSKKPLSFHLKRASPSKILKALGTGFKGVAEAASDVGASGILGQNSTLKNIEHAANTGAHMVNRAHERISQMGSTHLAMHAGGL